MKDIEKYDIFEKSKYITMTYIKSHKSHLFKIFLM